MSGGGHILRKQGRERFIIPPLTTLKLVHQTCRTRGRDHLGVGEEVARPRASSMPPKRGNRASPASPPTKRVKSDDMAREVAAAGISTERRIYWLGDSTISFLMSDGRRGKKQKGAADKCAAAWYALNEDLPSVNLGESGQQLAETVGSAKPLLKHVDQLVREANPTTPKPRAFVISAGYNNLSHGPSFILDTLTAQVDRLHAHFPDVPVLLLGLAVSHNGTDEVIEAAHQVTKGLTALGREETGSA